MNLLPINLGTLQLGQLEDGNLVDLEAFTDLLGNLYFQGMDGAVLYTHQLPKNFFDLKNKMAGDILQKFSNYRLRLIIIGSIESESRALDDFIRESNSGQLINFYPNMEAAKSTIK